MTAPGWMNLNGVSAEKRSPQFLAARLVNDVLKTRGELQALQFERADMDAPKDMALYNAITDLGKAFTALVEPVTDFGDILTLCQSANGSIQSHFSGWVIADMTADLEGTAESVYNVWIEPQKI